MSNNSGVISIGFDNFVNFQKVVAVLTPSGSGAKKRVSCAKEDGTLLDAAMGRKNRSVIVLENDYVILSALAPETIAMRARDEEDDE